jgi:hypothetical protein
MTMTTMLMDETNHRFGAETRTTTAARAMKARRWIGRVMTGLPLLFLTFDGIMKLARPPVVVAGTVQLGYAPSVIIPLGIVLTICVALYAVPRTAILGAVLLTGYLGGAIASHVRVGDPLFSHVLFPIYVAVLLWGGLYLRDGRLRGVFARPVCV